MLSAGPMPNPDMEGSVAAPAVPRTAFPDTSEASQGRVLSRKQISKIIQPPPLDRASSLLVEPAGAKKNIGEAEAPISYDLVFKDTLGSRAVSTNEDVNTPGGRAPSVNAATESRNNIGGDTAKPVQKNLTAQLLVTPVSVSADESKSATGAISSSANRMATIQESGIKRASYKDSSSPSKEHVHPANRPSLQNRHSLQYMKSAIPSRAHGQIGNPLPQMDIKRSFCPVDVTPQGVALRDTDIIFKKAAATHRELDDDAEQVEDLESMLSYALRSDQKSPLLDMVKKLSVHPHRSRKNKDKHGKEDGRFELLVDIEEVGKLVKQHAKTEHVKRWVVFDSFFAFLVTVDCIKDAVIHDSEIDKTKTWIWVSENGFLLAYIFEWCVRWRFHRKGLKHMLLKNKWADLDLVIIVSSVIDLWIITLVDRHSGGFSFPALRLLRLVRLIRMVKVIKSCHTLWIMVEALKHAMSSMFWLMILSLIICFVFGLILFELVDQNADKFFSEKLSGLGATMITMLQLNTKDHSGLIMRKLTAGSNGRGYLMCFIIPLVALVTFGVLHLIVGVLLVCVLEITRFDGKCSATFDKLKQHGNLAAMRELLLGHCKHHIGSEEGRYMLSRPSLVSMRENDPQLEQSMKDAHIGKEDIHSVFNELASFHGEEKVVEVDDFVQGCMFFQHQIHPLHLAHVTAGIKSMNARIGYLDELIDAENLILNHAIQQLVPTLKQWQSPQFNFWDWIQTIEPEAVDPYDTGPGEHGKEGFAFSAGAYLEATPICVTTGVLTEKEAKIAANSKRERKEAMVWACFDSFFVIVCVLNAIIIGMDAARTHNIDRNILSSDQRFDHFSWNIMEALFFLVFCVEFVFRVILAYQMEVLMNYKAAFYVMPDLLFGLDWKLTKEVIAYTPKVARDGFVAFDILILTLGFIDNFLLRFWMEETKSITVLKTFRLLRIMRVSRILYLAHELNELLVTMVDVFPVVLWSTMLLAVLIYITAIFFQTVVFDIYGRKHVPTEWRSLFHTMAHLLEIATFENWGQRGIELEDICGSWIYAVLIVFAAISSFGIVNICTGVALQAAMRVADSDHKWHERRLGADLKVAVVGAKTRLHTHLENKHSHRVGMRNVARRVLVRNFFWLWKYIHDERVRNAKILNAQAMNAQMNAQAMGKALSAQSDKTEATLSHSTCKTEATFQRVPSKVSEIDEEALMEAAKSKDFHLSSCRGTVDLEDTLQTFFDNGDQSGTIHLEPRQPNLHLMEPCNLKHLLKDKQLLKVLHQIGLRPDQLIVLFQKLDGEGQGKVSTPEFVEGVSLLFKKHVDGFDLAICKSTMRKLWLDMCEMERQAGLCNNTFTDVSFNLRGMVPDGSETFFEEAMADDYDDPNKENFDSKHARLTHENRILREKAARLTDYVQALSLALHSLGDTYAPVSVGMVGMQNPEEAFDDDSCKSVGSHYD